MARAFGQAGSTAARPLTTAVFIAPPEPDLVPAVAAYRTCWMPPALTDLPPTDASDDDAAAVGGREDGAGWLFATAPVPPGGGGGGLAGGAPLAERTTGLCTENGRA